MENEGVTVSFGLLMRFCLDQQAEERLAAIPSPKELRERYPDTSSLTKRVFDAIEKMRKEEKRQQRRPMHIAKTVLVAAAILISIFSCTMLASAEVRNAVIHTIIEWTDRNVGFRFETSGAVLTRLPDGYGPHYIPEGFTLREDLSYQENDGSIFLTYELENHEDSIDIEICIAEGSAMYWLDNEQTEFEMITFDGTTAYLGGWTAVAGHDGYTMLWVKDGLEHHVYANVQLSELFKIAKNIY